MKIFATKSYCGCCEYFLVEGAFRCRKGKDKEACERVAKREKHILKWSKNTRSIER